MQGRGGLGTLFIWASGNGGLHSDNCNCDGYTNSVHTLSVGSTTREGRVPWYSEACASTLTTTYSSGVAADPQIVSAARPAPIWACPPFPPPLPSSPSTPALPARPLLRLSLLPGLPWGTWNPEGAPDQAPGRHPFTRPPALLAGRLPRSVAWGALWVLFLAAALWHLLEVQGGF